MGFTPCKAEQPLPGTELQEKESQNIQEIGQRKAFYRQRIPEKRNCAKKETVDIAILVTSRNGDRKIMQSIWITSS